MVSWNLSLGHIRRDGLDQREFGFARDPAKIEGVGVVVKVGSGFVEKRVIERKFVSVVVGGRGSERDFDPSNLELSRKFILFRFLHPGLFIRRRLLLLLLFDKDFQGTRAIRNFFADITR